MGGLGHGMCICMVGECGWGRGDDGGGDSDDAQLLATGEPGGRRQAGEEAGGAGAATLWGSMRDSGSSCCARAPRPPWRAWAFAWPGCLVAQGVALSTAGLVRIAKFSWGGNGAACSLARALL